MAAFKWAKDFARECRANAAIIFALALVPVFAVAGFAIDLNRQQTYQHKIQNALDFAVVATARHALRNANSDDAQLKIIAQDFFDGEFGAMQEMTLNKITFKRDGDLVTLDVSGDMPTSLMQVVGKKRMPLGTTAAAVFGEPSSAEIALVLDTSYSMDGSKLTALRIAANDMVDTLVKPSNDAVKMSIVPFATYVNVGTDKKGQSWLDVQPNKTETKKSCSIPNSWYKKNCTRKSYSCTRDGVKKTCRKWVCDPDEKKDAPKTCKTKTTTQKWHGCVKSRKDPYNKSDTSYSTQKVYGFISNSASTCPTAIQELTNIPGQLKSTTAKLKANQNTYIATGLIWGLRTLSATAPFDEGADYAAVKAVNGRKALVLMSDGENTKSPNSNGYHNGSNKSQANDITKAVCDEIKSKEIELYTIAFEIDDATTKDLLKQCATSSDFYYDAKNAADLKDAFDKISNEFRDIALAN